MDVLQEIFSEANFIASALMTLVVMYWVLMIFGVVGMDMFDIDVDVDADVGIDVDLDADIEVDGSVTTAGAAEVDIDSGGSSTSAATGALRSVAQFFYLADVPVAIVASMFLFGYWTTSVILNHLFNPELDFTVSLIWVIPSATVAAIATRCMASPMSRILKQAEPEDTSRSHMIGKVACVTTSKITETFGQIEIKPEGEPEVVYNARTRPGETLAKGDAAKLISYDHQHNTFLVELTTWETESDE